MRHGSKWLATALYVLLALPAWSQVCDLQGLTNDADNVYAVGQTIVLTAVVTNNNIGTLKGGMQATVTRPDGTQEIVFGPKATDPVAGSETDQEEVFRYSFQSKDVGKWSATVVYGVQKKGQKPQILCSAGANWTVSKSAPPADANCAVTISTDQKDYAGTDAVVATVKVSNNSQADPLEGSLFIWLIHPNGTKENVADGSISLPPSTSEQGKYYFTLDDDLASGTYTLMAELVPSLGLGGCQASATITVTQPVCTQTITVKSLTGKTTFAPGEGATLRTIINNACTAPLEGPMIIWFEVGGVRSLIDGPTNIGVDANEAITMIDGVDIPEDAADGAAKLVVSIYPNDGSDPIEGALDITIKAPAPITCEKTITLTELTGRTEFQPGDELQLREVFTNTCDQAVTGALIHWIQYAGETTKTFQELATSFTMPAGVPPRVEDRVGPEAIRLPGNLPEGTSKLIVELFPNDGSASIKGEFNITVPAPEPCNPAITAGLGTGETRYYPGETVSVSREVESCDSGSLYGSMKTILVFPDGKTELELFLGDPNADPRQRERGELGGFDGSYVDIDLVNPEDPDENGDPKPLDRGTYKIKFEFVPDDGSASIKSNEVSVTVLAPTESKNK